MVSFERIQGFVVPIFCLGIGNSSNFFPSSVSTMEFLDFLLSSCSILTRPLLSSCLTAREVRAGSLATAQDISSWDTPLIPCISPANRARSTGYSLAPTPYCFIVLVSVFFSSIDMRAMTRENTKGMVSMCAFSLSCMRRGWCRFAYSLTYQLILLQNTPNSLICQYNKISESCGVMHYSVF